MTVSNSSSRIPALDVLRGLNIAAMIVFHSNLIYFPQPIDPLTGAIDVMGGYVAPLFFFLAGSGACFFLRRHAPIQLFKRGIFLFLLATAVSIFPKGNYFIEWTVIQDIGFAFILLAVIGLITPHRFALGAGLYGLFLAATLGFNFQVTGFFPFFPMVLYFLLGYGFACVCPTRESTRSPLRPIAFAGFTIFATLGVSVSLMPTPWAGLADILFRSGIFMALYVGFVYGLGRWQFSNWLGQFLIQIGTLTLTAYYVQQTILRLLQYIHFQVIVINVWFSYLLLMLAMFGLVYLVLVLWRRINYWGSLEWWMRKF